ncbi:MAG TPA: hypothetical protein VH854_08395 [Thermoanaerobaculia bacterium]|nr:hypothetical protein [Thermoanaerobaculia bacterium]
MKPLLLAAGLLAAAALSGRSFPEGGPPPGANAATDYDPDRTTHGFRLTPQGGAIEIAVNDGEDTESRDAIRAYLERMSKAFADGDFGAPLLIHGEKPPGVAVMTCEKAKIAWEYVETVRGGRVVATTDDAAARDVIHDFLRFEVEACRAEELADDSDE